VVNDIGRYIWVLVIMLLIACTFIFGILWIRPQVDAADFIGHAVIGIAPVIATVLTFMKSHDTGRQVNGSLQRLRDDAVATAVENVLKIERQRVAGEAAAAAAALKEPLPAEDQK
jgi:hypothetical protein